MRTQRRLIKAAVTAAFLAVGLLVALQGGQLRQWQAFATTPEVAHDASVVVEEGRPIRVVRAIDGDTVEFANGDRLRYVGIDTPEEVDPRKPVQCHAVEAAAANKALVEGKEITFFHDKTVKDKYGRWLGFVYLADGTFVNETLVRTGDAFAYRYPPDTSKDAVFKAAETAAKAAGLGLWGHCTVTRTSSGREQTDSVR